MEQVTMKATLILAARKRALAQGQNPEDKVEHPKGEAKDSNADKLREEQKH